MSLTGVPLLVLAALVSGAVGVATAAVWGRPGRARLLLRAVGVLLVEVCLLVTAGLAVNRSQLFYPTWSDLTRDAFATAHRPPAAVPAGLDRWLHERAGADQAGPVTFAWRPAESTAWRLSAAPTVVVPAGYLLHPTWSYPVVLVVAGDDWTDAAEAAAARSTGASVGPAVLVFLRPGPSLAADTLAVTVPHDLSLDLRVTPYHWALVVSGAPAALLRPVVLTTPGRFPAVAVAAADPPSDLPVGVTVTTATALPTALRWAVQQTPPPLATPEQVIDPGRTPRPAHRHRSAPATSAPSAAVTPPATVRSGPATGGGDVTGR